MQRTFGEDQVEAGDRLLMLLPVGAVIVCYCALSFSGINLSVVEGR